MKHIMAGFFSGALAALGVMCLIFLYQVMGPAIVLALLVGLAVAVTVAIIDWRTEKE